MAVVALAGVALALPAPGVRAADPTYAVSGVIEHQDDSPYSGVTVMLVHTTPGQVVLDGTATTAADGSYTMDVPARDGYIVRLNPDDTGADLSGFSVDVDGPTTLPSLKAPDYQYVDLTGRVLDSQGAGIAGSDVAIYRDDAGDCFGCHTLYAYRGGASRTVTTDSSGHYTLQHVRVGAALDLEASKIGYQPTTVFDHPWVRADESCCTVTVDTTHLAMADITMPGDGVTLPKLTFPHALKLRGPTVHLGSAIGSNADYFSVHPLATSATFTWLRDGVPIGGAQAHDLSRAPTPADAGHRLQLLEQAASAPFYRPAMRKSNAVAVKWSGIHLTPGPIRVGTRLTFLENDGRHHPGRYSHVQWLLDGRPIPGATHDFYTPKTRDRGHRLSVRNTADAPAFAPARTSHGRVVYRALTGS